MWGNNNFNLSPIAAICVVVISDIITILPHTTTPCTRTKTTEICMNYLSNLMIFIRSIYHVSIFRQFE